MDQAFNIQAVKLHKQPERRCRTDRAAIFLTQALTHEHALQPRLDVTRSLIRPALVGAAMDARGLPGGRLGWRQLDARSHLDRRLGQTLRGLRLATWLALEITRGRHHRRQDQLVTSAAKQGLDDAMHEQVRITANRAGEVRVSLIRQAEVPAVGGRVDGLLHRAQQHRVDLHGVGPLLRGLCDGLELSRRGLFTNAQPQAQRLQVVAQGAALLGCRALVHPVKRWVLATHDEVGRADVGRQHALLDEPMGIGAHTRDDARDAPVLVANDLGFGGFKIHGATAGTSLQQSAVHLVQVQQMRHQRSAALSFGTARVAQDGRYFGVGQARMRIDDRREELVGMQLTFGCDQHVADHRQSLDLGVERAQAIGELLRQHRDDAPRKVDRGRSLISVPVQGLVGLDVVTDVGDGHDQAPGVRGLATTDHGRLAIDRVIEVTRVFAVNGHQGHVGQVDAPFLVGRPHLLGQLGSLSQHVIAEAVRHLVFPHRDLDLHARVIDAAQHLDNPTDRLRRERWRLGQLHRHHLSGLCACRGLGRNEDVLTKAPVLRRNQPGPALVEQPANDRCLATLDDLEHQTLRTPLPIEANHPHLHAIAVQNRAHLLRRKVDTGLAVVADDKAVTISMSLDGSDDFTHQAHKLGGGCCHA